jgi:hypothetical protein
MILSDDDDALAEPKAAPALDGEQLDEDALAEHLAELEAEQLEAGRLQLEAAPPLPADGATTPPVAATAPEPVVLEPDEEMAAVTPAVPVEEAAADSAGSASRGASGNDTLGARLARGPSEARQASGGATETVTSGGGTEVSECATHLSIIKRNIQTLVETHGGAALLLQSQVPQLYKTMFKVDLTVPLSTGHWVLGTSTQYCKKLGEFLATIDGVICMKESTPGRGDSVTMATNLAKSLADVVKTRRSILDGVEKGTNVVCHVCKPAHTLLWLEDTDGYQTGTKVKHDMQSIRKVRALPARGGQAPSAFPLVHILCTAFLYGSA